MERPGRVIAQQTPRPPTRSSSTPLFVNLVFTHRTRRRTSALGENEHTRSRTRRRTHTNTHTRTQTHTNTHEETNTHDHARVNGANGVNGIASVDSLASLPLGRPGYHRAMSLTPLAPAPRWILCPENNSWERRLVARALQHYATTPFWISGGRSGVSVHHLDGPMDCGACTPALCNHTILVIHSQCPENLDRLLSRPAPKGSAPCQWSR